MFALHFAALYNNIWVYVFSVFDVSGYLIFVRFFGSGSLPPGVVRRWPCERRMREARVRGMAAALTGVRNIFQNLAIFLAGSFSVVSKRNLAFQVINQRFLSSYLVDTREVLQAGILVGLDKSTHPTMR